MEAVTDDHDSRTTIATTQSPWRIKSAAPTPATARVGQPSLTCTATFTRSSVAATATTAFPGKPVCGQSCCTPASTACASDYVDTGDVGSCAYTTVAAFQLGAGNPLCARSATPTGA